MVGVTRYSGFLFGSLLEPSDVAAKSDDLL